MTAARPTVPQLAPRSGRGGRAAASRGAQLRAVVMQAVARRKLALFGGWSRMPRPMVNDALRRLEVWLQQNPNPGPIALRAFGNLADDVRTLALGNAAGRKLVRELDAILNA